MAPSSRFLWAGGIEDTFIIDRHRTTSKTLEEYELIDHYGRWRQDLEAAASLGIDALRWGIPWYRVEPARGRFDWNWIDDVLGFMTEELSLEPIVDLSHYGAPAWLREAWLDRDFLPAYSEYVVAFAERFASKVRYVTPINEPYTAAEFCGRRGDWPPYRKSDKGFVGVLTAASKAAVEASIVLKRKGLVTVHVEVASGAFPLDPAAREQAEHITLENELYWDLITGRVDEAHPLAQWLRANGFTEDDMAWFLDRSREPLIDVMGVNYYPQWSYRVVGVTERGGAQSGGGAGEGVFGFPISGGARVLERHLRRFWEKYRLPLMITETSVKGTTWEKSDWLRDSTRLVTALIAEGIEIVGFTWFPLIDMIDWEYRNRPGDAADFLVDLGLWGMDRRAYSAASVYRSIISGSRTAAG